MCEKIFIAYVAAILLLSSCATSNHGSFASSTYIDPITKPVYQEVGTVIGASKQTWFLYVFPIGESPSTAEAISDAKSKIFGTRFLTDITIDDRTYWKFGYSEQVIEVKATAYK